MKNNLDNVKEYQDSHKKNVYSLFIFKFSKWVFSKFVLKKCQYCTIIVDDTPDVSHKEQLVFIIRYVFENAWTCDIQERFLTMVDYEKKNRIWYCK